MMHPIVRDPILEEARAYHQAARDRALRRAAGYERLQHRLYDSMEHTDPQEIRDYIRWGIDKLRSFQEYQLKLADYHQSMILFWVNSRENGAEMPAAPRRPRRCNVWL